MTEIDRRRYANLYGPTTGDRIRLADTDLLIQIERDDCAGGDEAVFGGGKVIRESMGQSRATRAEGTPDTVITGAVILDHWGIVKADVGIRDGRIVGIGRAGNPDIMDGVDPALVIGPSTEIVAGNGRILTAGAIDCHVHLIAPLILEEALASGITTIVGGGTGPAEGSKATTVTPGAWHLARMFEALDPWPVNVLLLGKGNTVSEPAMWEQLRAGAGGFKLHEDWGTTPAAIDACLRVADASGCRSTSTPTRSTRRASSRRPCGRSAAGRSTPITRRGPAAGTHPTSSPSRRTRTCCRPRRTRPGRTPATPSANISTCSSSATISTRACRRTWRSPRAGSGPRRWRPRTCCTTWARSRSSARTPRRWAGSARSCCAPGRRRTS